MRIQNNKHNRKISIYKLFYSAGIVALIFAAQIISVAAQNQTRSLIVVTEPKAKVWLDDINYGTSDANGKLVLQPVAAGAHKIRVRADGFKETVQAVTAAQKGEVKIALIKTEDKAELAFQEAERLMQIDRQKAIAMYQNAANLRPKYAEAYLAMARAMSDAGDYADALKAVAAARKARPAYPEATAVEGRIYVSQGEEEKAIAAFKRAVTEGKGFQPEAYTGIGLLYKERAESAASGGDFEAEKENYRLAADNFKKAVAQLAGAPDAITIYQFLGLAYERAKDFPAAIKVYEEFLRVFPDSSEATAVRSFIVQLKKQMNGEQ